MTWSRLFRRTAATSTLVLVGMWLWSLCCKTEISYHPDSLGLSVTQACVGVRHSEYHPQGTGTSFGGGKPPAKGTITPFYPMGYPGEPSWIQRNFSIHHVPVASTPATGLLGTWKQELRREIKTFSFPPMGRPEDRPFWIHRTVYFPLWVPWLFFVTSALVLCRFMEKRTASGKEKELAETRRSGMLPIDG